MAVVLLADPADISIRWICNECETTQLLYEISDVNWLSIMLTDVNNTLIGLLKKRTMILMFYIK